jgi:MoaA/NifB/PqqE/SkfB family radical SAM enzyme
MLSFKRRLLLLKGLWNGKKAFIGPEIVDLDLTNRCNLTCVGCPYHSPIIPLEQRFESRQQDFPLVLFQKLLGQLEAVHAHTLVFQGSGEPLLHPQITEMLQAASSRGFATHLLTNGILMDGNIAEGILDAGTHGIRISLWASNENEYTLNYPGTPVKFFSCIQDNIKRLNELKIKKRSKTRVLLYCVINVHNMASLNKFVQIARETDCDGLHFGPFYKTYNSKTDSSLNKEQRKEIVSRMHEVRSTLRRYALQENVNWFLTRLSLNDPSWVQYPCYEPWFHARIFSNGDVGGCTRCIPQKVYGNLHNEEFAAIWNNNAIQQARIKYTRNGAVAELMKECDCKSCCFGWQIKKIHGVFRFFLPVQN